MAENYEVKGAMDDLGYNVRQSLRTLANALPTKGRDSKADAAIRKAVPEITNAVNSCELQILRAVADDCC